MLLENGKYGIIKSATFQQLETLENTYNFEVEDYHTYYVGNDGILTHNTGNCGSSYGIYEDVDYHTTGNSVKNARPIDGQSALNNSYQISTNSPRRLGYSNNQLVVLDKTEIRVINNIEIPVYHGHVREYSELTNHMKNIAVNHFGFRR